MCMKTIEKRTVLAEPILAWKIVMEDHRLTRNITHYRTATRADRAPIGEWLQCYPEDPKRIGGLNGTSYGFHTYESRDAAESVMRLIGGMVVPVAIAGRAAYGVQRQEYSRSFCGYTAEWIYYLKVGPNAK